MRFVTICLALLLSCAAWAQTGTEGSILGIVKDSSGAAVPKASVAVTNTETGLALNLASDDGGFFQAFALPRGSYSVVVSAAHFTTWRPPNAALAPADPKPTSPAFTS